jgi:signal transduction histidine kinase/CheY-like chemotaxis protein
MIAEVAQRVGESIEVLLVEDDEEDHLITRDCLARVPGTYYELTWARTSGEGISALEQRGFDLCLLDFRLGAEDGFAFLRDAEARGLRTPVVVLTGSSDPALDRRLMKAGAAEFLEKGRLEPQLLERLIRYTTRQARAERAQRLLADASRMLASSLEEEILLGIAARTAVPELADWSWIVIASPDGGRGATGLFHRDPAGLERARELLGEGSIEPSRCDQLFEGAESDLAVSLSEADLEQLVTSQVEAGSWSRLDTGSAIAAPLEVRGNLRGAFILGRSRARRPFDESDMGLARKVADAVAMALENARLYRATREAVKLRNDVLSMVSHDLGNPLAAIVMVVQRLLERPAEGESPQMRSRLQMIQTSAKSMVRLVEDLLAVGRLEAGHFTVDRKRSDLGPLIARTVRQFRLAASQERVELDVHVPSGTAPVEMDDGRIGQVLSNLLSNALKFTPRGGRVSLRVQGGEGEVVVSVSDSGPGLDPEEMSWLFEPFWQSGKNAKGGAGLGLTIAHEIVRAHGGRIWAESEPGRGSIFRFALPRAGRSST